QSTRLRKAFSSTEPFLNGVTSAVNEPRKLVLAVMTRSPMVPSPAQAPTAPPPTHKYRVVGGLERALRLRWGSRPAFAVKIANPGESLQRLAFLKCCRAKRFCEDGAGAQRDGRTHTGDDCHSACARARNHRHRSRRCHSRATDRADPVAASPPG